MTRVLILGSRGLLGSSLSMRLQLLGYEVFRQSRSPGFEICVNPFDVADFAESLSRICPSVVVNLIAFTDVDRCERQPQLAFEANVLPVQSFLKAVQISCIKPHLIHVSSDQIYDGNGPHTETNVSPPNVYALSKLAAELAISDYPSTILRTNFFGASRTPSRTSFSDWVVSSLRSKSPITVFEDVQFSALHIDTLCDVIAGAVKQKPFGIFNVGTADGVSKAEFAFSLAQQLCLSTDYLHIGSVADANLLARRPLDMRLDCSLFEDTFRMIAPMMSLQIYHTVCDYNELSS